MKISQKGLYALQAIMMLARHHQDGAIKVRDIAQEENLPPKFLELILVAEPILRSRATFDLGNLRCT